MVRPLKRLLVLNHRKQSARRLGLNFHRAADFTLPSEIRMDSQSLPLSLPDDVGTRTAFVDVLLDDCYGLQQLPDDLQTVLDIGAHAGLFSLAARMRYPQAQIHAYEPNPQVQSFLAKQAAVGGFSYFGCAVGLTEGRVSLDVCDDSVQTRVHRGENGDIQCLSFAQALTRLQGPPDLVKMDCEGGEWEILQDDIAWQKVRNVTMEFHLWAGYTMEQLRNRISQLGFQEHYCKLTGKDFGLLLAGRDHGLIQ